MSVGFIGLGKLGLPVSTCMAAKGHHVLGYDPYVTEYPTDLSYERGFGHLKNQGQIEFADLETVVRSCDPIFIAVQTPHQPEYEGITRIPDQRVDFDYSYLKDAARQIRTLADEHNVTPRVVVISTVLPGTMEREVIPILGHLRLVYSPSFIAMGTTIRDFLDPEFVLLGGAPEDVEAVRSIYEDCGISKFYETSVRNAELVKVSYNTLIGLKLAFANTLMEVCHKTGCDVDEVTGALKKADRRLISGAYLDGGMGDGGGCHPRDNIALSWLARKLDLSYDLFDAAMKQRENQSEWLADLMEAEAEETGLPLGILGVAYKPSSHLTAGSPALLLKNLLKERGHRVGWYDPYVSVPDEDWVELTTPRVWLVGCKHPDFRRLTLPEGSVVIDPWRYVVSNARVIRIGGEG